MNKELKFYFRWRTQRNYRLFKIADCGPLRFVLRLDEFDGLEPIASYWPSAQKYHRL